MDISGHIENGVVVLEGGVNLPEGTKVIVSLPTSVAIPPRADRPRKRIVFPIIPSKNPGSLDLTAERIAEILSEQDASA
jgi:hypothetical protein